MTDKGSVGFDDTLEGIASIKTGVNGVPPSVDKLLETYTKYERTSLLELAVWKASCLWLDGSQNFHTMQDIVDQWTMNSRFDPTAYKEERRYTGNDSVIMLGVLSYLERWFLVVYP